MQQTEDQTGDRQRESLSRGFGEMPMLLILLALCSVTFLGLATVSIAVAEETPAGSGQPPMVLPADAGTSSGNRVRGSDSNSWIVGGIPGDRTASIASRSGGSVVNASLGSYRVPRARAAGLARRLAKAGRLVYAEPDVRINHSGYPSDLLSGEQWWLNRIVSPGDVTPPSVTANSPLIALVEESLDPLHPDLASADLSGAKSLGPAADWHGTAVAGIAGSPGEDGGIRGVWPGARMRLFPSGLTCSTASKAVTKAAKYGSAVINMSYTFPAGSCFTHFMATQYAVRMGAVPVAAAGNSGESGNEAFRPAVDPHVLSVGAIDDEMTIAPFSTRNSEVDIVAPGASVFAPYVSAAADGTSSGTVDYSWENVSGTSFSAPMVSAAAAWLSQARPALGNMQLNRLLTSSATDLGTPGRDPEYGSGLLSIEKSLAAPAPAADPYEPNDDISWLNGSLIKPKSPYLWKAGAGKRRILKATLSRSKDPADVYKVQIPARSGILVNAAQLEGDLVLSALKPKAKTIVKPGRNLIVRSNRSYPKTEGILVRNLKKKPQTVWVSLTPSSTSSAEYIRYRITVVRR